MADEAGQHEVTRETPVEAEIVDDETHLTIGSAELVGDPLDVHLAIVEADRQLTHLAEEDQP